MAMTVTFVDAGVPIEAARGDGERAEIALTLLDDPDREYASSSFVRLEVEPKSSYTGRKEESEFYQEFFAAVRHWPESIADVVTRAHAVGAEHGLGALDALHVAAAELMNVDEFVTTERPNTPLHRVTSISMLSIYTS